MSVSQNKDSATSSIRHGLMAAWPVCLGYVPVGLALGILAQKAGVPPLEIGLMSLLVYAGSSQFVAIAMLSDGATIATIIATTFVVNLRHFLMSSALSVYLGRFSRGILSLFAYGVTDESFGVNLSRFKYGRWDIKSAFIVNQAPNITWITSTVLGGYGGRFIPAGAFGIDYALTAMFIYLLVYQLKGRKYVFTAVISGGLAVALYLLVPGESYIVLASVLAATLGVVFKKQFGEDS